MTDWIDELRNSISDTQRRAHDSERARLMDANLLESRLPDFFASVTAGFDAQVSELNDKVGNIKFQKHDGGFTVNGGKAVNVSITGRYDLRGHLLTVTTAKKGAMYVGDGAMETYSLHIDGDKRVYASHSRTPDGRSMIYQPDEIATAVLKSAFTKDVFGG